MKPQIIFETNYQGKHNEDKKSEERLKKAKSYKDLSTICIVPTRGMIPARVVQNWMSMMIPMNQKFTRLFIIGLEVGDAYNQAIEWIETYDVVGGLYWTKGEGGQPMIYGNPKVMPKNFIPQMPIPDALQEANGLGMGFNLFRMAIFKDKKLEKPWFKTEQSYELGKGTKMYTQDLYFYEKAGKLGYRFASDNRIRTGHYSVETDQIW